MVGAIEIQGRAIGPGMPAYIVAELSGNHHHNLDCAVELLHAAKDAGADAVKLQTYTPDTLTIDCDRDCFRVKDTPWANRNLYELYQQAHTPWEWQPKLKRIADGMNLPLFSTPFDASAVAFLERMAVPAYKIASFELVDLDLIRLVAGTGKPLIISTGMGTLAEIEAAVSAAREAGAEQLALLKCNSAYPAPPGEMNLRTIPHLAETFGVPVGLSDHSLSLAVPVTAVALGACLIEKHFTLSRATPGPDSAFSLEPSEFRQMVEAVRLAECALGGVRYGPRGDEIKSLVFRRSLFVVADMKAGENFSRENVRCIRPGYGLAPRHFDEVNGRRARCDIERGTPLSWQHLG